MRADLLALDEAALTSIANRGLLKRATREVADGAGPAITEQDGTVLGTFSDGTRVELPPNVTLDASACSCGAPGVCRHRLATVLVYQGTTGVGEGTTPAAPPELDPWSPGEFDDDDLRRLLGPRVFAAARKSLAQGFRARVHRPSTADPVAHVELASCTVRFLVPHELGYARVDAAQGKRADAIALAVWAFREADAHEAPGDLDLTIGGLPATDRRRTALSGLMPVLADVLADGMTHLGPSIVTTFRAARRDLDTAKLQWPLDALDELTDQLTEYGTRGARYSAPRAADLVAELVARHRCVSGEGASQPVDVLGNNEPSETPLRLVRLTGLGARIGADATSRLLEIYLAHESAGIVLTLRRRVDGAEGELPDAATLGQRRAGGARLARLAAANVVTESAVRSANRVIRLAENRVARTNVMESTGDWASLPGGLMVTDVAAEQARLAALAPGVVRPRFVGEAVRVVPVASVEDVRWLPGAQRLVAQIVAPSGRVQVALPYSSAAPGAVDALASALTGEVRFIAGHLRRHGGVLVLEPTAVVSDGGVVVPAFAARHSVEIGAGGVAVELDPLAEVVHEAHAISAEVVHQGWRHLKPSWRTRAAHSSDRLREVGFEALASSTTGMVSVIARSDQATQALVAWSDHHLRLMLTSEQL